MTDDAVEEKNFLDNELAWEFLLQRNEEAILLYPFLNYFEQVTDCIYSQLHDLQHDISKQSLRLLIASHMEVVLLELVKRTLVWEFNLSKRKSSVLVIKEFLRNISTEEQSTKLLKKYPVLGVLLKKIIENYQGMVIKFLSRLKADQFELCRIFSLSGFQLFSFSLKGDAHSFGNRVLAVDFKHQSSNAIKKIIYKPRDVNLEACFNDYIQFMNLQNIDIHLKTITIISKEQYGWMEHIDQEAVEETAAEDYYTNLGLLLGICSTLNGQDIHFENVIASGSVPVIVDLECLFSPPISELQYNDKHFPSLFDTLIIPFKSNTKAADYDFSAVLNHSRQESFMERFEVRGDFEKNVYIARSTVNIVPSNNVLINKLTETPFSASKYSSMIAYGYKTYLNWFISHKKEAIHFIGTHFSNLKNRVLFRPTFVYTKILLESYHPRLLSDFNQYHTYLAQLKKDDNELYNILCEDEIFDLLNGDIPHFSTMTNDIIIKNSQGKKINYVSYRSGMERVLSKIDYLDEAYIEETVTQILASLKDRYV